MTHPLIEAYRLAVLRGRTTEPDIAAYETAEDNLARALRMTDLDSIIEECAVNAGGTAMTNRANYLLETGACLLLWYMEAVVAVLITTAVFHNGNWPLAFLYPPLSTAFFGSVILWRERPSLHNRSSK